MQLNAPRLPLCELPCDVSCMPSDVTCVMCNSAEGEDSKIKSRFREVYSRVKNDQVSSHTKLASLSGVVL